MKAQLYLRSVNAKTGAIPTSISSECPSSCVLQGDGCYAENFPLNMHWDRVKRLGPSWDRFCHLVASMPEGQLWRHNVAGDLPQSSPNIIDRPKLAELIEANKGRRGFTYTHIPIHGNKSVIDHANKSGFTINSSANNVEQARWLRSRYPSVPVVCVLPIHPKPEPDVVICPNHINKSITCDKCELCANPDRDFIIGFPAHGTRAKRAEKATQ